MTFERTVFYTKTPDELKAEREERRKRYEDVRFERAMQTVTMLLICAPTVSVILFV